MKFWPSQQGPIVLVDHPKFKIVEEDGRPSITCKRCGRTSHNPVDARNCYCGFCKRFLLDPEPEALTAVNGEGIRGGQIERGATGGT